jgi:hypothetical protein
VSLIDASGGNIFAEQTKIFIIKKQGGRMGTQALAKATERMPSVFDDFFKP